MFIVSIYKTFIMLYNLSAFCTLVDAGSKITKMEVIKRYRRLASFNYVVLQFLCMMQFSVMGKNDKGEVYVC